MSFSDRKLHIRLEYDRRTLYEINADDIQSDITIGRGQDNVWHLPAQDISAHRQHAVLKKLRRGGLVLESCQGREGLFYLGRPIKERRLQVGDVCGISDSTLIVEEIASEENNANRLLFHQLEQLTGEKKGKIYPIKNDFFSIGSAPGCDCQLQDSLVSQKHAIIELQADGTCRIKDNRSRNGTTVNGTPVHDSVGRMLKDGDIIAISYLEFKFWDKNVVHVRSHLILKLCAIIATLALVLGGYFAYQTIRPSAKAIRLRAEQYAAHTQFPMAEQLLKEAVEARGAEQDKTQRLDLERKLKLWQETLSDWLEMQEGILEGNESEDFILLCAKVAAKNAECWSWSTAEGLAQMKVAQDTNNLLVFTRSCEEALATSVTEEKYLLEQQGGLEIAIQRCREEHPPFRQELLSRAEDTDAEMRHTLGTYRDLQNLLLGYKNLAQTKELVDKIHRLSQQCDEHLAERNEEGRVASKMVQRRCEAYLEPLEMLLQSYDLLMANYDSLAKFDFASFRPSLPLPSQDSCKIASTLPDRRAEIETANANLERLLIQLENYRKWFDREFPEGKSALLRNLFSDKTTDALLSFDCLKKKMPTYSEKKATSVYDRVLGIYVFFEYLRALEVDFNNTVFDERFKPQLFQALDIFRYLESFLNFCNPPANSPRRQDMEMLLDAAPGQNKLVRLLEATVKIQKQRETYLRELYGLFQNERTKRRGIVAGGIVCCLMNKRHTFITGNMREEVSESFKQLRQELAKISSTTAGEVSPERMLEIEKQLLDKGIPGDPFLKQPWTDKFDRQ